MNKQKFNRKEYIINIINKLCFLLVMSIILYFPLKFAKHYLFDLSYQEILEFPWRGDRCESHSGEPKFECSCGGGMIEPDDEFKITKDGYLHWKDQLVGKVVLIEKPSFFTTGEILTGGYMKIIDSKTGDICYYDSVMN